MMYSAGRVAFPFDFSPSSAAIVYVGTMITYIYTPPGKECDFERLFCREHFRFSFRQCDAILRKLEAVDSQSRLPLSCLVTFPNFGSAASAWLPRVKI